MGEGRGERGMNGHTRTMYIVQLVGHLQLLAETTICQLETGGKATGGTFINQHRHSYTVLGQPLGIKSKASDLSCRP